MNIKKLSGKDTYFFLNKKILNKKIPKIYFLGF